MNPVLKFGTFEVDLSAGEIHRDGRLVRLQQQPFEVLRTLLEQPGELVTREALRQQLWPDGVVVDYDQSLNKSLTKLRMALGDAASNPRFIQTLPKRGYRFIAPITQPLVVEPERPTEAPSLSVGTLLPAPRPSTRRAVVLMALIAGGALLAFVGPTRSTPAPSVLAKSATSQPDPPAATPIVAARDAYERGRVALARGTESSVRQSVELFARAIALSPRYATAYAELAQAWSTLASDGTSEPGDAWTRARQSATFALTLDPTLSVAHAALGEVALVSDRDWPTAETHFRRAIDLDAGNATARSWYARGLSSIGKHEDAESEAYRALAADSLSLVTNTTLGTVLYRARRFEEAMASVRRALDIDPEFAPAQRMLGLIQLQRDRPEEASKALAVVAKTRGECPAALAELAHARAKAGDTDGARRLVANAAERAQRQYGSPASLAFGYLGLGRTAEALSWLERAREADPAALVGAAVDPRWDGLRAEPRFRALVDTVARATLRE